MRAISLTLVLALVLAAVPSVQADDNALSFEMKTLAGKPKKLADYKGRVLLIVNVASECGLTPQYEQLQALHEVYKDQGLSILGFPCNQFGRQEPGSAKEIQEFCTENYGVKFDMFSKVDVNGDEACDLYKYLTKQKTNPKGPGKVSWNFEKFLVSKDGKVVARFQPRTKPDSEQVVKQIQAELKK